MCWIKRAACLPVFQCKSCIISYHICLCGPQKMCCRDTSRISVCNMTKFFVAAMTPRCGNECDASNDVMVTSRRGVFISSHDVSGGACAVTGQLCPLLIRAETGQRLTVTMWNFSSRQSKYRDVQQVNACVRSVARQFISCCLLTTFKPKQHLIEVNSMRCRNML